MKQHAVGLQAVRDKPVVSRTDGQQPCLQAVKQICMIHWIRTVQVFTDLGVGRGAVFRFRAVLLIAVECLQKCCWGCWQASMCGVKGALPLQKAEICQAR